MELTDGIVTIRPPIDADAGEIVEGVRLSHNELYPWMPWAKADYDLADAMPWIDGQLDPHPFVIIAPDGHVVGTIGLNGIDTINGIANLGYWLRTDRAGNGYATMASKLVADYGLTALAFQRIEIVMSVENEPSRAVARRTGAAYEGVLRNRLRLHGRMHDAHSYSLIPRTG
ncbi:MAG: GNAT family N-acetyltransferase [Actinomycetota bacterium]